MSEADLELLRAGLYAQFFEEIQKGVACFLDSETFGRSPLEAASFIVSSAFGDKALHGSGFLPRLERELNGAVRPQVMIKLLGRSPRLGLKRLGTTK